MTKEEKIAYARLYRAANREHVDAYQKKYREDNKERMSQQRMDYRIENKETLNERKKAYRASNLEHVKGLERAADRRRRAKDTFLISEISRRYLVDEERASALFVKSMQSCEICDTKWTEGERRLAVDHNHTTGEVRGVLCGRCNQALGYLEEDISIMQALINYTLKHNGQIQTTL